MSEVIAISEDHRKTLIDIFFSVMISDAIGQFVSRFLLGDSNKPSFFFFLDFINNYIHSYVDISSRPINSPEHWLDALFFAATFFWIICHWIFYHELIKKYPYYRWRKFFVDITLFVLMSIVLRISLFSSFNPVFTLFISLIAFWYFLAYLWHLSDKGLRPVNLYANSLLVKCVIYSSISIIFILFNTIFLANYKQGLETVNNLNVIIKWLVVAPLIVLLNAERLNKFISRKATLSHCCLFYNQDDYSLTEGFPEGYLPQMFAKKVIDISTEHYQREFEKNIIKEGNPRGVQVNKNIFNINQHAAELIEFLIVLCFSRVTGFHDPSFGFKEERIPITEIEHFSNGHDNNTFLNTLHKLTNKIPESNITEFYDLRLPKNIIKQRKIWRSKDGVFFNSGVIIMSRGYFRIKIRYERTEHFAHSSSILLRLIPWKKIGRLSINPIFSDNHNDDGVMNRKWYTYHIEVDIDVSIATRLHSIFSESISRQLGWSDIVASSFIEFFDIKRYMNNLEKYEIS